MKKLVPLLMSILLFASCSQQSAITGVKYSDYPKAKEKLNNPDMVFKASVKRLADIESIKKNEGSEKGEFQYSRKSELVQLKPANREFKRTNIKHRENEALPQSLIKTKQSPFHWIKEEHTGPVLSNEPKEGNVKGNRDLELVEVIVSIILPPLAMYLFQDSTEQFLLNILLTILGWLPGIIHALIILDRN